MRIGRREFLGKIAAASASTLLMPSILDMLGGNALAGQIGSTYDLDEDHIAAILEKGLYRGGDFSELYFETINSLSFKLSERAFSEATVGFTQGAGVRTVEDTKNGYAYVNGLEYRDLLDAAATSAFITKGGSQGHCAQAVNAKLPGTVAFKVPLNSISETNKMELIQAAEQAARDYSPFVKQVDIEYYDESKRRLIANSNGLRIKNEIPMIWVVILVLAEKDGVRHQGRSRISAHQGFEFFDSNDINQAARDAAREAVAMLSAKPAPSGEMPVVIQNGWGGVLIHEAVGHGLEADVIYRGTSIYSDKLGKKVGSELVTMIDDSSWPNARGTTEFDDEGTIGRRNVLIEKGVVTGFMHDLISAKKLGLEPSGNGRRESYHHYPIPRMTNTFLDNGTSKSQNIISSTNKGLYVRALSGGSVDTVSGQFNFIVREAYLIENGKITSPVAGATLIGRGIDVLTNIDAVAGDLELGVGICGKEQWVPVTAGLPTVRVANGITVGGNA